MLHDSLWDPASDIRANLRAYLDEIVSVIKPGGVWLCITLWPRHLARSLLLGAGSSEFEMEVLNDHDDGNGGGTIECYGFVVRKNRTDKP